MCSEREYLPKFDYIYWAIGGALYIVGAIIYMLRIPERWYPMKFDFFVNILKILNLKGASHQIFHCCILAAALMHYYASLQAYHNREHSPCPNEFLDLLKDQK